MTYPMVTGTEPLRSTRFVGVAWGLLFVNTLGYVSASAVIPLPKSAAQVITMGALALAFGLALTINPRIRIRPNVYLTCLSLLVVVSIFGTLGLKSGYGSFLRCTRLLVFVTVLWILSGWWRGDLRFARYHLNALSVVLLSIVVGLIINPGAALSGPDGRLAGLIWPMPPPQVAHYSATALGLAVIMWITRRLDGRSAALIAVAGAVILVLTRTRTGLFGVALGLVVCLLALNFTSTRARRFLTTLVVLGGTAALLLGPIIIAWLARGQDADSLSNFTGRAKVWEQLLAHPRSPLELAVGIGLTDKSFNGLPIDNSWYSIYHEQGWAGLVLVAAYLLALLFAIVLRPLNPERACALFLVVYCISASYTEAGLGDASPYLLDLAVATSLLVTADRHRLLERRRGARHDPEHMERLPHDRERAEHGSAR